MQIFKKIVKANGRVKIYFLGILIFSGKISKKNQASVLKNVFHTNFPKKVLLSYIISPFIEQKHQRHTNILECYTAAEIFKELGYNVDVVDFQSDIKMDVSQYDICYGFGVTYNKLLENKNVISIMYGTGCSLLYSNRVSLHKLSEFYNKTKLMAYSSIRYLPQEAYKALFLSDLIIPLGNKFTAETYKIEGGCSNIKNLPCFYYNDYAIDAENKDFAQIKKNFLWFGSTGLLHKGLDLLIEIFSRRDDIHLYICGANKNEVEFFDYYAKALNNHIQNIHNLGFVDLNSSKFKEVMNNCVACLFPSLSEGGSPSMLTVMGNGGLIPIASQAAGVDISHYGFEFEKIDEKHIEEKINRIIQLSDEKLQELSVKIQKETQQKYTYDNYKNNLKKIISELNNNIK